MDLFEPTLAFCPRLPPNGFIFVHDNNNRRYSGARHAVDSFLSRTQAAAMPMPEFAGSLMVLK